MKKKILIFTPHFYPENFIINDFVKKLSSKYIFFIITSSPHYPKKEYFKDYSIFNIYEKKNNSLFILRLPVLGRMGNSLFFLSLNYISYLISFIIFFPVFFFIKFHSIFIFQTSPVTVALPAILIKFFFNKKITIWVLDIWPEVITSVSHITKKNIIYKLLNLITIFIYKYSDTILVSSRQFKKNINSKIKKKDIIFFPQWSINKLKQDKKLVKNDNTFKIFHIGNMGSAQDLESLAKAIRLSNRDNISWHFVGDGSERNKFEKKLKYFGIEKNIYFYGLVPQQFLNEFYNKADALILSLKRSPILKLYLPARLSDYLYHSKPILLMASGDVFDIIKEHQCGLVSKSAEYKKLALNIDKLFKSSENFKIKLSQNSKKLYKKYFDFTNAYRIIRDKCF